MASDAGPPRSPILFLTRPGARTLLLVPILLLAVIARANAQDLGPWPQHSMERPRPSVIDPGPGALPVPPPADAMILFDGRDLANWEGDDSTAAKWRVADGYMEVVPGTGGIHTRRGFGDCQLHIEWATPTPPHGESQERGNSGVFLMGRYELQVLDSYDNITYADGQAAAIYGEYPPLVNASRPPGVWQSYDIVFHRPRFSSTGAVLSPARFTVFHNGVLVQDNVALVGPTANMRRPPYTPHPDRLPLGLQDHGVKVRFRNIWIRALE
jgi:3-keto-disaccharide hydrolase